MKKFLIIQTAFIGDVVLATGLIEKLHYYFPGATIDFLLRKGNETLLAGHPYLDEVLVRSAAANMIKSSTYNVLQLPAFLRLSPAPRKQ